MRLIDADALEKYMDTRVSDLREMYGDYDHYTDGFDDALQVVEDAPTIDAVPVVRCKECKNFALAGKAPFMYYRCTCGNGLASAVRESDFCSYGERRSE